MGSHGMSRGGEGRSATFPRAFFLFRVPGAPCLSLRGIFDVPVGMMMSRIVDRVRTRKEVPCNYRQACGSLNSRDAGLTIHIGITNYRYGVCHRRSCFAAACAGCVESSGAST